MIVAIAVTAAAVIAILTLALVIRDAARNGYQITGGVSFKLAKQFPPAPRAAAAGKPAALTGVPDRDTGSAA